MNSFGVTLVKAIPWYYHHLDFDYLVHLETETGKNEAGKRGKKEGKKHRKKGSS